MSSEYEGKWYDYLTLELKPDQSVSLYGWDKYPAHSVLAHQQRKCYLRRFDTTTEAGEAHPKVQWSNQWTERQIVLPND